MTKITPHRAHQELGELLYKIPDAECMQAYSDFHVEYADEMLKMPASVSKHHSLSGGYVVHIYEVTRNLVSRLETGVFPSGTRPELGAAIIAAYIHDLDKLFWRYEVDTEPPTDAQRKYAMSLPGLTITASDTKTTLSKKIDAAKNHRPQPKPEELSIHRYRQDCLSMDDAAAVACLVAEHKLPGVTPEVMHAVSLHHGGWAPLAQTSGHIVLRPLAVLLHAADMESSQIQNGEC